MYRGIFDDALFERIKNPQRFLSKRVQHFCQFFALHGVGRQAVIEAGYNAEHAASIYQQLTQNEYVRAYINELCASIFDKIGLSRLEIAKKYKEIINQDIREIFNDDGTIKELKDMPDRVSNTIARIKIEEIYDGKGQRKRAKGRTVDVYLYDKMKAMDAVRQMAGYNEEKSGITINNSNVQVNFNDIRIVEVTLNI